MPKVKLICEQCKAERTVWKQRAAQGDAKLCRACRYESLRKAETDKVWKTEEVECPDCHDKRTVTYYSARPFDGRCHSCASKEMTKRESWRAATTRRNEARWTDEAKERQSALSREQVLRQGGVPNAKKFVYQGRDRTQDILDRDSNEMRAWRIAVYVRDNHTCQICDQRGGKLHAHHIRSFAKNEELRFAVDNGLTTCKDCHFEVIHRGAWGNEPMTMEEINTLRQMVAAGAVSIDWSEAA